MEERQRGTRGKGRQIQECKEGCIRKSRGEKRLKEGRGGGE